MSRALKDLPNIEKYWELDRGNPPKFLVERSGEDLGNEPVRKEIFHSREYAEREHQRMWKRVWQMACRENDIPNVGDRIAYDIGDQSVILVRTVTGVRGFHNVCLHRGNRLVEDAENAPDIRCPFHGFSWDLEGRLAHVPCRWDFPELRDDKAGLSEVRVDTWNGWVFVNLDPDCGNLEDFLGKDVRRHWERWPAHRAWKAAHIGKVVPCNWKLAIEAFLEVWHVSTTHPQMIPYLDDVGSQYDSYGPHARFISPFGAPSPNLEGELGADGVVAAMLEDTFAGNFSGDREGGSGFPTLQPGQHPRHLLADVIKDVLHAQTGRDYSGDSDMEVLDGIQYYIFPNLVSFAGFGYPLNYRVRPNGDDPKSCLFEVMVLTYLPDGADLPPDVPLRMTPVDEPWSAAPEMGGMGPVMEQDALNLARLQRGIASDGIKTVRFGNYQERTLRNLHQHLDRYVEG